MSNLRKRKDYDKKVLQKMIGIYCRSHHKSRKLCDECSKLLEYAKQRIELCPLAENKTSCRKCPIHCYNGEQKTKIIGVMRFVGPRLIFRDPIMALRHLIKELF